MRTSMKPSCLCQPSLQQVPHLKRARAANFIFYMVAPRRQQVQFATLTFLIENHIRNQSEWHDLSLHCQSWFLLTESDGFFPPRSQFRPITRCSPGKFCAAVKWCGGHPQTKRLCSWYQQCLPSFINKSSVQEGRRIGASCARLKAAVRCRLLLFCAQATGKVAPRMSKSDTERDEMWQAVLMKERRTTELSEKCSAFQHKRQGQPQPVPRSPFRTAAAITFNLNHNSNIFFLPLTWCDVKYVLPLVSLIKNH